ncbi:hypothetical protein DFH07DRAFT_946002 [Mycena maculata]|uniref:SAM domain-containing protein n=1 Tax=Mycena maculata TaxID=230809 RepID=A0AAD7MPB9_9AGAR|nr:hypothetical protein DFH07DRAFT_946002 [Mycena maculata]
MCFNTIVGGRGGRGGRGGLIGGAGGVGEGIQLPQFPSIIPGQGHSPTPLLSFESDLPTLTVAEFGQRYQLSPTICLLLEDQGFATVGALFEVDERALRRAGLKPGHIAEIKRALKEFSREHGISATKS